MKHTKNMVYNETIESTELALFIDNDVELYGYIKSAIKTLAKKYNKGIYDSAKAVDIYYPIATMGAKKYCKVFGGTWNEIFSIQVRYTVAVELQENYFHLVQEIE